ncbi:MAG: aminotransferase class I/II-fold pyridoxal phosphate-dependent enzyme [Spirochaetales bacterium]|nr:aminotransferase class I/II-fold pyridoxal phosphate-dependent enzyme [Spirochaetales bacterium]
MMREKMNSAVFDLRRSAIREFAKLAKQIPGCISLTLGEPDFDTPQPIRKQAELSLENGETHYIENNGLKALREKIASFETDRHGFRYSEDQVIVTSGATEALFVSLFGILNPDDEVIIPTPAFVLYEEIVKLCRAKAVKLDTSVTGFQIRKSALEALVTQRTKAIVLNSPNNPTGTVLDIESLNAVRLLARERNLFVICDDVYNQLIYTDNYHSFTEFEDVRDRTILVQSYSKPYAMTGWRMGYLIAPAEIKERLELVHQFTVVSTPAPFQKAAVTALDFDPAELRETYRRRRAYMLSRLRAMDLEVPEPEGAFYMFPSIRKFGIDSSTFCRRMIEEAGLAATPGFCFGSDDHIRLTYCYSDPELAEGLDRLQSFIRKLEGK